MKKIIFLTAFMAALMLLWGASAETEIPAVGDNIQGFTVESVTDIESTGCTAVTMTHDKTGAIAQWIACDDTNREFAIGFRTKAWNDEGIAHIFEHATLSGNEKYPDPSLFFSMMKQTYNTYLNASTMSRITMFPSASLSEEQLAVYVDYALNGVFHPTIMTDERAMMREAYRYELADADAPLTLQGTVYSEMSAVMSADTELRRELNKLMYPGSYFGYIFGGDPDYIPDLTWEELKAYHDSYYHPSNAMAVLYGDLDLDRFLGMLNEAFSAFEPAEIIVEDDDMSVNPGFSRADYTFPVSADSAAETTIEYAFPLTGLTLSDSARMGVVTSAMGDDNSPLISAVREKFPQAVPGVGMDWDNAEPMLIFSLSEASVEDADAFKQLVDDSIAEWLAEGLDPDALDAAAASVRFYTAVQGESSLADQLTVQSLYYWSLFEDPRAAAGYYSTITHLSDDLEDGAFDALVRRYLTAPESSALVTMTTVPGQLEEKNAALTEALQAKKDAMTPEEIDALVARTADFAAWTEANAADSMIDQMKAVDARTLPEEVVQPEYPVVEEEIDGVRYLLSRVSESDITIVDLQMDASAVSEEDLLAYSLYVNIMNLCDTGNYSAEELATRINRYTCGTLSLYNYVTEIGGGESWLPLFGESWYMLRGEEAQATDLARERLLGCDDSDITFIRDCLKRNYAQLKQAYEASPENPIKALYLAHVGGKEGYQYLTSSRPYNEYMNAFLEADEDAARAIIDQGRAALANALNRNTLTVSIIGDAEGIAAAKEQLRGLIADIPAVEVTPNDYSKIIAQSDVSTGITISGNVNYNAIVANRTDMGVPYSGIDMVMGNLIPDSLLLPQLRFKNSAYNAKLFFTEQGVYMFSYRDPKFTETFEYYDILADELRALELTRDDIDGYITAAFSALAKPVGPLSCALTAVNDYFSGKDTFAETLQYMREVKAVTPEAAEAFADVVADMVEKGIRHSVGNEETLTANADMFDEVLPLSRWLGQAQGA